MHDIQLDLRAVKTMVTAWIRGLGDSERRLPVAVAKQLLEQLSGAALFLDADGVPSLELPALASLGRGIFRCSFRVNGALVRISPYAPAGAKPPLPPPFGPRHAVPALIPRAQMDSGPLLGTPVPGRA